MYLSIYTKNNNHIKTHNCTIFEFFIKSMLLSELYNLEFILIMTISLILCILVKY